MKKTMNRFLSLALALMLCVGLLPTTAIAAELQQNDNGDYYVNLPITGTDTLDLSDKTAGFSFKVRDNGGSYEYANDSDGTLLIYAPANCRFKFSGSGATGALDSFDENDFLRIYDGDSSVQLGEDYTGSFGITTTYTTGNVLKVYFYSDITQTGPGFTLYVDIVQASGSTATLTFDHGDGSGTMNAISAAPGTNVTVPACTFTPPENKLFSRYTDGTNEYRPGDVFALSADKTLTAVYADKVAVTYEYDGTTNTTYAAQGSAITLATFTSMLTLPDRKLFDYWLCGETHYGEGDSVTVTENVVFTAVLTDEPVILHSETYPNYSKVPQTDTLTADLSDWHAGDVLWVFDDGGASGNYSNYCRGTLLVKAPSDCVLRLSGSGSAESGYDYLRLYDGDTDVVIGKNKNSGSFTVSEGMTTGNVLKIYFYSDSSSNSSGFVLNVTLVARSTLATLSFDAGEGSGTMDSITVMPGSDVTVPESCFTVPENKMFIGYTDGETMYQPNDVITLDANKTLTAVYADSAVVTYAYGENEKTFTVGKGSTIELATFASLFTMPERMQLSGWQCGETLYQAGDEYTVNGDVTFTAVLEEQPVILHGTEGTAYANYANYSLLPKSTNVTADLSEQSAGYVLSIFDDGGVNNYSNNCDGSITVIAPEGCLLRVSGDVMSEQNYDKLTVYDGNSTDANVLGGPYSGTTSFTTGKNNALYSTGRAVTIRFKSDGSTNKSGVYVSVRVYNPASLVTLSFDPGEGSGSMDDIVLLPGDQTYLPNCGFTLPEKTFFGHYTDGTNNYSANSLITVTEDMVLTAIYADAVYFTYTNGLTEKVEKYRKGATPGLLYYSSYTYPLFSELPYRKEFKAWSINGIEYNPGYHYPANEDITIEAVFNQLPILQDDGNGGVFVTMPKHEDIPVSLADKTNGFTFTLYDDGGKTNNYTNNSDGSLTFTAPEGYVFSISGSGIIENYQNTKNDWLRIYDSDTTTVLGDDPYGGTFTVSELTTTSNRVKIAFHCDDSGVYDGFALTVKMIDPSTQRTITFAAGEGTGTMDPVVVLSDTAYTLPSCGFTAPNDRIFAGWTDGMTTYLTGQSHFFTENTTLTAVWAEITGVTYIYDGNTHGIPVPKNAYILLPAFTDYYTLPNRMEFMGWKESISGVIYQSGETCYISDATNFTAVLEPIPVLVSDGEGGWYANMVAGETITADVTGRPDGFTFTVYDDGGKDGQYAINKAGLLTVKAAPGVLIKVSGTMKTEASYDKLYFFDDSGTEYSKRLGVYGYSGSQTIGELSTTGNYLTIWFYSDSSGADDGFALTVTLEMQTAITYVYGENSEIVPFEPGDVVELEEFEDLFTLPEGYEFICWKDENNETYAEEQEITPTASMSLTAVLELMPTVTLDGSGATLLAAYGGDGTITVSPAFPVLKNIPMSLPHAKDFFEVPAGKVFGGWQLNGAGQIHNVGEELSTVEDVTLTAVWVEPSAWDNMVATLLAAESGATIELTEDLIGGTGSDILTLPEGVTATIDLKGHTVDGTATAAANDGIMISALGTLTVVDSVGTGSIVGGAVQVFGNEGLAAPDSILSGFAAGVELNYRSNNEWNRYVALYYPTAKDALEMAYGIGETYQIALPANDASETYVFLLRDVTIPEDETWTVYTGYSWINLDLNGHTFNVLGTLTGSGKLFIDSTTAGTFRSSGVIDLDLSPYTDDACFFTGGTVNGYIRTYNGSLTISGGTFNGEIFIDGDFAVSGGTFNNTVVIRDGSAAISGGTYEEEFTAYGGTVEITGGTFIHWVNFDNFYDGPVLSLSGEANLGGLYFEIDTDSNASAAKLIVAGNARIAEMGCNVDGNGTGSKPMAILSGGYYGREGNHGYQNPQTWSAALGEAVEFVFSAPVQTYDAQADWACDGTDYPWRISGAEALQFYGASLTLQNNLQVNFAVRKDLIENNGYADPKVVFEMNGVQTTVSNWSTVRSGETEYYCFRFSNIAPDKMNDTITATLYATVNGTEYASAPFAYSIATYCYSQLGKTTDTYLRTLLVDLLNYGAASQMYTGYNTNALVNEKLTEEQRAWGTADEPELHSVTNAQYRTVATREVTWAGASLLLNDSITMQFLFTADSTENLTIRIEDTDGTLLREIPASALTALDAYYVARFRGLNAGEMKKTVLVTAYRNGTAVSDTVSYSIESYACAKQNSTVPYLAAMVKAMMQYGNAAYAYAHRG